MQRLTIFYKVVLFIVLLLIPILALYSYSNRVSVSVVQNEIRNSIGKQLAFLQSRFDIQLNHVARGAYQLIGDPILSSYATLDGFEDLFDEIAAKKRVEERIAIQNVTLGYLTESTVFFPADEVAINPNRTVVYERDYLLEHVGHGWIAQKVQSRHQENVRFDFLFYAVTPLEKFPSPFEAKQIVEIRFSDENLIAILDDYKITGKGDPFLYHPQLGVIANRTRDSAMIEQVTAAISQEDLADSGYISLEIFGDSHLIYYIPFTMEGWTLVDYVPLHQVFTPIEKSNRLFYISILLLLLMSIFASFMLYRHVQSPILMLIRHLRLVKNGDLTTRIHYAKNNEFKFVFQRFNEMVHQIQELIENVYKEQLRSRDAELKQLQSQINPHFLYNCLYFIVNMARLERFFPIERMAMSLSEFFKYSTRLENSDTTIADEINTVRNYLEIQKLRMDRITFEIDVPMEMKGLTIPRLILQPIVENAVIHGIEPKLGGGHIRVTGERTDNGYAKIIVEDNGAGMSENKMKELTEQLVHPVMEGAGYGAWNVHQRLILRFGEQSGITYASVPAGGIKVTLAWQIVNHMEGDCSHVSNYDR